MTDKQIIIDGVDVSGCPHYIHKDGSCSSQDCECIKCVHNVCFYKDYKAKEQECEELRGVIRKDICSHYVLGECSQTHHNNCVGRNQCIKDLEQECERLQNIINEAKNSKLDLKSFLVGEAVQNEYEEQLDQLKAENEELKIYIESNEQQVKEVETLVMDNDRLINELNQLKQALNEIKEIAELKQKQSVFVGETVFEQILEKISEVIDVENN